MKLPIITKHARIIKKILTPPVMLWFLICWCIMKCGRSIYWFGNMLSGFRLDPYNWLQDI